MTILGRRLSQRALNAPSQAVDPSIKRALMYADSCGPMGQRQGLVVECQELCVSLIQPLLNERSPSAVRRFVVAVCVDSIQRVIRTRTYAHIAEEIRNRFFPAFADANTTTAVIVEALVLCVVTTINHRGPCEIFRSARQAVRWLGRVAIHGCHRASMTTARCRMAFEHVDKSDAFFLTAVAATQRVTIARLRASRISRQYCQLAKTLSDQVRRPLGSGHMCILPLQLRAELIAE